MRQERKFKDPGQPGVSPASYGNGGGRKEGRADPVRLTVGAWWVPVKESNTTEGFLFSGNRRFPAVSTFCTCNEWGDD